LRRAGCLYTVNTVWVQTALVSGSPVGDRRVASTR
jgi:hypothetical protein